MNEYSEPKQLARLLAFNLIMKIPTNVDPSQCPLFP